MTTFRYRALDEQGREFSDTVEASSLYEASTQLRSAEVSVTGIEAVTSSQIRHEPTEQRPPDPPRDLDIKVSSAPGGWILIGVGALFSVVATIFILIGIGLIVGGQSGGVFFVLFPLIHLSVGVGLLVFGLGRRSKRRRILQTGQVAMATIEGVGYNRSVRVNGRNPYELVWAFDVDGHRYHDKYSSFDERVMSFVPGDRMWAIYDPQDPESSVEWPPL